MIDCGSLGLNDQFVMSDTVLDTVWVWPEKIISMEALLRALQTVFWVTLAMDMQPMM